MVPIMDDRARVTVSVAIVLVGIVLAVAAGSLVTEAETDQAQGTVIDFGDRETIWTDAELSQYGTELDLLIFACDHNGLSITFDDDGRITEIDGITNADGSEWGLWVIYPGSLEWVKLDAPYDQNPSDFTISSWSYVAEGEEPTVAVDYSGNPIYGYQQKLRAVSLSPSITEILASVKAENIETGVCVSCGKCVAHCPMGLMPNRMFRNIKYGNYQAAMDLGLMDCKECGCCAYTCPSHLPLVQGFKLGKKMGRKKK